MVEFEELRLRLLDSEKPIENLKEALAIDSLKAEVEVLEKGERERRPGLLGRYGEQPKGDAKDRFLKGQGHRL